VMYEVGNIGARKVIQVTFTGAEGENGSTINRGMKRSMKTTRRVWYVMVQRPLKGIITSASGGGMELGSGRWKAARGWGGRRSYRPL
jgi:hypothetical protein